MTQQQTLDFDGATYARDFDYDRLNAQLKRVYDVMKDGKWRTYAEISAEMPFGTQDPQASISARLRDFRKAKFGLFKVDRRARGGREKGLFEYRLRIRGDNGETT